MIESMRTIIMDNECLEYETSCNTLVLTPFALNIYDVNIVITHGGS